jgi:transcription initiation factor TFIIIB Brf1 subunit/transcription initiation factor TFIIB
MRKLKSCPFCAGKAELIRVGSNRKSSIVSCEDCGCTIESSSTGDNSGDAWNMRAKKINLKMKKNSIVALMAHFEGTHTAISLDQHRTTGISLELYTRHRDNYQTLAYFEGSTVKECVKQAFKWDESSEPIGKMCKKQFFSFKREELFKTASSLGIDDGVIESLLARL